MPASLRFESDVGTVTTDLGSVRIITLADKEDNQYTLNIATDDLKVGYKPNGGNKTEYAVNGLATALGKLLTIDGSTAGKSVLAEEVAKKPVVEAIFDATHGGDKISETKIDATFARKTALANKANTADVYTRADADAAFVKTNASNLTEPVNKKAFAEAIFPAKDGNKLVLVDNLGKFLSSMDKAMYDGTSNQTAKDFLATKGLLKSQGSAAALPSNHDSVQAPVVNANVDDEGFKGAARGVISHLQLEIPDSADAPISAYW